MLPPEDVDRLVVLCRCLPRAEGNYLEDDFITNLLTTVVDFQMQTPTVVRAIEHFKSHRWAEIRAMDDLEALLTQYPDTEESNTAVAQHLWGYDLWTRVGLLRGLVRYFDGIGVRDQPALTAWAATSDFGRDFEGRVKGLGFAVYKWLVMRQGVDTVKPDVHLHRFVEGAVGRPLSDADVVEAVELAARELGLRATALDWAIWETQRQTIRPAPVRIPPKVTVQPAVATFAAAQGVETFVDDDAGYLRWVAAHPGGYVLNCARRPNPAYLILHRATCRFVTGTPPRGRQWTVAYIKVCALTTTEIDTWTTATGGGASSRCSICHP